ncbi:T9SS type A sorting domain-containing protein [Tamlana sp. 62-3]|uniref:T9SS type A sorting domain-containing protein n=1 Tax=Neotamlana sargassicola TaxID=2883125 RepID=A0A9X1I974_9FLAO|nr:T9SS type A sorting domain-containing protein [Tamlana sargassicola]MCB4809129.1 T9SS type A sorting domain-containing protein [Tamlana sargassicola]
MIKTFYFLFLISFSLYSQTQIGDPININAEHIETSSDGNKIAILEDINGTVNVKTYIYNNSEWTTNSENDISNLDMGVDNSSLSMSKDGNILAVGSSNRNFNSPDPNLMNIGIVRVYENINDLWVQVGNDLTTGNELDGFGNSSRGNGIDLSEDGSIIAIGALDYYANGEFGDDYGLVKVFSNNQGTWEQMGNDIIGELDSHTGQAVSLSNDGFVLAVGASKHQNFKGQIKVYNFQNDNWIQIGNAINGEAEGDLLGTTVSLSGNGNKLALSVPNSGNYTLGYAKVFENINDNWTQIGQTVGGDGTYYRFGLRLSYSSDGSILALSSVDNTTIYQVTGNTINQFNTVINSNSSPMNISSDGTKLIVQNSSEVLVYDITAIPLSTEEFTNQKVSFYPNPADDMVNITLENNDILKQATIFNIYGKSMLSSQNNLINTSLLPSGMYIVEIDTLFGKSFKKLIIK